MPNSAEKKRAVALGENPAARLFPQNLRSCVKKKKALRIRADNYQPFIDRELPQVIWVSEMQNSSWSGGKSRRNVVTDAVRDQ